MEGPSWGVMFLPMVWPLLPQTMPSTATLLLGPFSILNVGQQLL